MRDEKISQHYVPRLHLRRFPSKHGKDTVYCFDKQNKRSFRTSVSNIAAEDFFYDDKTELVPEVENFLEKLERRTGGPYSKITENENLSCLKNKEKTTLALFLGIQMVRTPGTRSSVRGIVEGIYERVPREKMAKDLREGLDELKQEESLREI